VQYSLAVDRSNKDVANLYNSCDPAVLRLIDMTIQAANRANIPASLCGRMSSSTTYTQLLLGLGLRQLSITPGSIPEVKRLIRALNMQQCEVIAKKALGMEHARDIKAYCRDELKKVAPEFTQH
jgi:phosphoenolpyruvate-protein phosphotransferase (PTS system enzyme I)